MRLKRLESKFRDMQNKSREMREQHDELKDAADEREDLIEEKTQKLARAELELETLRLSVVRLSNENVSINGDLKSSQQKTREMEKCVTRMRTQHLKDLEAARCATMAETQQILKQYPKLEEECKQLRDTNLRLQQIIRKADDQLSKKVSSCSSASTTLQVCPGKNTTCKLSYTHGKASNKNMLSLARSLRQMEQAEHPSMSLQSMPSGSRPAEKNSYRIDGGGKGIVDSKKYSKMSLRIASAANTKRLLATKQRTTQASDLLAPTSKRKPNRADDPAGLSKNGKREFDQRESRNSSMFRRQKPDDGNSFHSRNSHGIGDSSETMSGTNKFKRQKPDGPGRTQSRLSFPSLHKRIF